MGLTYWASDRIWSVKWTTIAGDPDQKQVSVAKVATECISCGYLAMLFSCCVKSYYETFLM